MPHPAACQEKFNSRNNDWIMVVFHMCVTISTFISSNNILCMLHPCKAVTYFLIACGQTILQMTTYILGGLRSINQAFPQELVKLICQKESLPLPLAKGTHGSPWTWVHIKAHAGLQAPQSLFTSILPAPTAFSPPHSTVSVPLLLVSLCVPSVSLSCCWTLPDAFDIL